MSSFAERLKVTHALTAVSEASDALAAELNNGNLPKAAVVVKKQSIALADVVEALNERIDNLAE
jgi:hypothetical protein